MIALRHHLNDNLRYVYICDRCVFVNIVHLLRKNRVTTTKIENSKSLGIFLNKIFKLLSLWCFVHLIDFFLLFKFGICILIILIWRHFNIVCSWFLFFILFFILFFYLLLRVFGYRELQRVIPALLFFFIKSWGIILRIKFSFSFFPIPWIVWWFLTLCRTLISFFFCDLFLLKFFFFCFFA